MGLIKRWFNTVSHTESKPFILMYHRIVDDFQRGPFPIQPGMYVSKQNFEESIVFLKNNFTITSLEDLLGSMHQKQPVNNHCAITFDDGWEDNYLNAFPLLCKHRVPAALFLATAYIGTDKWFWFDELAFFINNVALSKQLEIFKKNSVPASVIRTLRTGMFRNVITKVVYEIKYNTTALDRNNLMSDVCEMNRNYGQSSKVMLDWDQVVAMKSSGLVDVYSHSHRHENLDQCSRHYVFQDIKLSLDELSGHIQQPGAKIFCYPSGKNNEITASVLKSLGFDYAVTTERGFVETGDNYGIKRIGVHDDIIHKVLHGLR